MVKLRHYAVTLKDGAPLLIEAEAFNTTQLPGWMVFTRNGKGWQAVATHTIKAGPEEVQLECDGAALTATLADLQLKEQDAPGE